MGHESRRLTWIGPSQYKNKVIIIIILKLNLEVNPGQDLGYWSRILIQVGWLTQINIYIKIIIIIILKLNLKINLHQNLDQKSRVTQDKRGSFV